MAKTKKLVPQTYIYTMIVGRKNYVQACGNPGFFYPHYTQLSFGPARKTAIAFTGEEKAKQALEATGFASTRAFEFETVMLEVEIYKPAAKSKSKPKNYA